MASGRLLCHLIAFVALQARLGYTARVKHRKHQRLHSVSNDEVRSKSVDDTADNFLSDPRCHRVFSKLVNLIKFDETVGIAHADEDKLMKELISDITSANGTTMTMSRTLLDRIWGIETLANQDLESALQADGVVTESDINHLNHCLANSTGEIAPEDVETDEYGLRNNGVQIVEGDIVLPPADSLLEENQSRVWSRNSQQWAGKLWSDGELPWCFQSGTSSKVQRVFRKVIKKIQQKTCVQFKELSVKSDTACQKIPSLMIKSDEKGSFSAVGFHSWYSNRGRSQPVNIDASWGATPGTITHELGHALGLAHEHQRIDRDKYITIHWDNIKEDWKKWFRQKDQAYTRIAYDLSSIMHYARYAGSGTAINAKKPLLSAKRSGHNDKIGQRVGFSQLDFAQLKKMYSCR